MKETVLITGGAGFIGHITANQLATRGCRVRVLDNLSRQVHPDPERSLARLHPAVEFILGDVCDHEAVHSALDGIDVVYHFAAETGVGQSMYEIERYSDTNIHGTAVLCDCVVKRGRKLHKIILSSSRAVYGEGRYRCAHCGDVYPKARSLAQLKSERWNPICPKCGGEVEPGACSETTRTHPVSIYGFTKKVQEELLCMVSATYNIPLVVLRYFNVFGTGQTVSNPYTGVLTVFCSRLLNNEDIEIYEDGMMQRDFVPIQDIVDANITALHLEVSSRLVLNIGSGVPRTVLDLAHYLKTETDSHSAITITGRYRVGDIRHCYSDTSRARQRLGRPTTSSFEQGIRSLVAWVRSDSSRAPLEESLAELSNFRLTGRAKAA